MAHNRTYIVSFLILSSYFSFSFPNINRYGRSNNYLVPPNFGWFLMPLIASHFEVSTHLFFLLPCLFLLILFHLLLPFPCLLKSPSPVFPFGKEKQ